MDSLKQICYIYIMTLREFFDRYPWIEQCDVASNAGINESTFRGYVCEVRRPSERTLAKIEDTIKAMLIEPGDFTLTN